MINPRIASLLALRGLTIPKLAEKIGRTRQAVHAVLTGKWRSDDMINDIAQALSITALDLVRFLDDSDVSLAEVELAANA